MDLRKFAVVSMVLGLAAFAQGCGDACVSACEDAKECEGAPQDTNCETQCDEGKADAEALGCTSEYDALLSCASGVDDICNPPEDACETEIGNFGDCFAEACGGDDPPEPCGL
jgi:hypothetical protein